MENQTVEEFNWQHRTSQPVLMLPFIEGIPNADKAKVLTAWVKQNSDRYENKLVRFYHATDKNLPIEEEGLKPTSLLRRRSYQSESSHVYLANTPDRAKVFGDLGNQSRSVVYEVVVLIYTLLPDKDQLNNQRSIGVTIGNSIGESIVFGGGVRVKGKIEPWAIRKLSEYEMTQIRNKSMDLIDGHHSTSACKPQCCNENLSPSKLSRRFT